MASNILYLRMKKAVKRLNRSLDEEKAHKDLQEESRRPPEETGKGQPGKGSPGGRVCGGVVSALRTPGSHALGCKRRWHGGILPVLQPENDALRKVFW